MRHIDTDRLYADLAACDPKLRRNRVWCRECGRTLAFDSESGFRHGWPQCCGMTMTIDAPDDAESRP
jgi:hypothetical protein